MRWQLSAIAWLALLAPLAALRGNQPPPPADRVDQLIQQLGDESYPRRVAAEKALLELGEPILPKLRRAIAENQDHETRRHSSYLVRAILLAARTSRSTGLEMAVIKPGEFPMGLVNIGGARTDDGHHQVTISRTFLLGVYEVTQEQYTKVMGTNPSFYSAANGGKDKITGQPAERFPVETVTWFDAAAFCNELSKLDGFPQHYKIEEVKKEKGSIVSAKVSAASLSGYRLPTEAEWEFACRAGTTSNFHYGNSSTGFESNLRPGPSQAYGAAHAAALERPTKVGSYKPNSWGLFDMHGNIAEWCGDWYDKDYYPKSPPKDPPGPETGAHRVLRGGSWMVNEANCRSASRFYQIPGEATSFAGFRVARTP